MKKRILSKLGALVLILLAFVCPLSSDVFATNEVFAIKTEEPCVVEKPNKRRRYITNVKDQEALAIIFGNYIVECNANYKEIAEEFNVSKTMVRDYIKKLGEVNNPLYKRVIKIVEHNRYLTKSHQRRRCKYITKPKVQNIRAAKIGNYIVEHNATYMNAAKEFNISKTTVRYYIKKLEAIDNPLYKNVRKVVEHNRWSGAGRTDSEQRVLAYCLGNYIVKNETNYVETAAAFGVSKTTVGDYIKKLKKIDELLYKEVRQVVEWHKHRGKCFKEVIRCKHEEK